MMAGIGIFIAIDELDMMMSLIDSVLRLVFDGIWWGAFKIGR